MQLLYKILQLAHAYPEEVGYCMNFMAKESLLVILLCRSWSLLAWSCTEQNLLDHLAKLDRLEENPRAWFVCLIGSGMQLSGHLITFLRQAHALKTNLLLFCWVLFMDQLLYITANCKLSLTSSRTWFHMSDYLWQLHTWSKQDRAPGLHYWW